MSLPRLTPLAVVVLMLVACAEKEEFRLPAVAGEWNLRQGPAAVQPVKVAVDLGLARSFSAVYAGTPEITVTVYEMRTATGAFELRQKWRPAEGTLPFHQGRFLVVVTGEREAARRFAAAFEKLLPR